MTHVILPIIVAIDGQAGSGKSTLAGALASELGLAYINTGLMYRALARAAVAEKIGFGDADSLAARARAIDFALDHDQDDASPPALLVDGAVPGAELQDPAVEAAVSSVSRHPAVRSVMVGEQRRLGANGAVMEGRDIGSVVFPDAVAKIFLRASEATRAARRISQRGGDDTLGPQLSARDSKDARTNAPMPAEGAVEIDTENKKAGEVLADALSIVRAAVSERDGGS
jgi:cytidylate kinase